MVNTDYSYLFEGKFTKTHKGSTNMLEYLYYRFSSATRTERLLFKNLREISKGFTDLKILDVGCGGGHKELTQYGKVYGLDISSSSIDNAKKIYYKALVHDLSKKSFPFDNDFFDIAFCSEVIGHIDYNDKDHVLSEIKRVLKPNGYFISSIETYGDNILTKLLKFKNLYSKYWIDYQGHIGLEKPEDTVNRVGKYLNIKKKLSNSNHLLPIDGYLIFEDILPMLKFLKNNFIRRTLNIILFLPFYFSLILFPFSSSNDITIVAKKK